MRVVMRVRISGTRDGADWPPVGGELDLPDREAVELIAAGYAAPVPDAPIETATNELRERTTVPRLRKGSRA